MGDTFEITNWKNYFKDFTKKNLNRPAKLETLSQLGLEREVDWLPLTGIAVELKGDGAPVFNLMFSGPNGESNHYTHFVNSVEKVFGRGPYLAPTALDFEAEDGSKTILTLAEARAVTSGA